MNRIIVFWHLKQIYRSFLKHKVISGISIVGFALSSAILILLIAFISSEKGHEKDIQGVSNIYRVIANGDNADIPEDAADILIEKLPEIQQASNYYVGYKPVIFKNKSYPSKMICTDSSLFSMLGVKVLKGSISDFYTVDNQVVLTESFAKKIFNGENPVGQQINLSHKNDVVVAAVIKDFPQNRSLEGQVFCSLKLKVTFSQRGWNGKSTYFDKLLIKIQDGSPVKEVEGKLKPIINNLFEGYAEDDYSYKLLPYKNAYFTPVAYDGLNHANVKLLDLLSWLALCIFIFAVFNYVNFTLAKVSADLKNIGISQVMGASKSKIFRRFILEAFLQLVVSLVVSVFIIYAIKPLFEVILGQPIPFNSLLSSPRLMLLLGLSVLLVAVLSGSYPAYVALRAKPEILLKNKVAGMRKQHDIRMPLNIIQFAASIVAVIAFMTIQRQIDYVKNQDVGFDTEQLVRINVHYKIKDYVPALIDRIGSLPGVKSICPTHGTPWAIYSYSENETNGRFSEISSDSHFLETFNVNLIAGRNFFEGEKSVTALINRKALKQLNWDTFEGKTLFGAEVVGVIDDFHFSDLHNEIGALMIRNENDLSHLNVRLKPGDIHGTMQQVEKVFSEIAGNFSFEYQFYDDWMDSMYRKEEDQARSIRFISVIALLLAALGMLGLASYSLKRRVKEVGIRKVNGAKIWDVMMMLNRDFIKWVTIAFIIACPVAWYAMHKWLQNFAYKTNFELVDILLWQDCWHWELHY